MSTYKMDWKENDIVKSDDMNRIEENVYNAQEMLDTKLDTSGDGSNLSSIFTQASVRENINSGDSLKTIMAKMKKWFSDLKPLAFKEKISMEDLEQTVKTMVNNALQSSAVANNLTTTNEKMVLGAPMGKELSEQISELNQNLVDKSTLQIESLGNTSAFDIANNLKRGEEKHIRIIGATSHPPNYDDECDFFFDIKRLDESVLWWRIIAYDIRSNRIFTVTCYNGTIQNWSELNSSPNLIITDPITTINKMWMQWDESIGKHRLKVSWSAHGTTYNHSFINDGTF